MSAEYRDHEEFRRRTAKLAQIRDMGIEPYPHVFSPTHTARHLWQQYQNESVGSSDDAAAGSTPTVVVAGRLILFRSMGKNAFAHVQDASGRIQIMCNRGLTHMTGILPDGEISSMKFIEKFLDLGDIIGVEGHLFRTHVGELTIFAKTVTLLCKTLLPLPDKHSGISDKAVRYRKRWLDLIVHPNVVETFRLRSRVLQSVRQYCISHGFLEVETPVLQTVYGGAQARPFITYLHALDQEMFLRISLEIPLKKLIVGGMDKVFEIGKVFRNEGLDRTHNPEFTELEAYAAYWDYNDMMTFTEQLFASIALDVFGTTQIVIATEMNGHEHTIDLRTPWKRLSMKEAIQLYAHIDVDALDTVEIGELLVKKGGYRPEEVHHLSKGMLIAELFGEFVEPHLIQPHHIIDHPIETTPLCKPHRNPALRAAGFVERFESFVLGQEFCNSYTELNDPELQLALLEEQARKKAAGDEEANPLDEEFIEAICQGLPPTGGLGIGLDRLIMLFCRAHSIRDVLYFPITRPEE